MIVIDASTIISAVLGDENMRAADSMLDYAAENGALVPGNFFTEVGNAIARAERRGRIDAVKADIRLTEIMALPLTIEMPDPHAIFAVVRTHQLTAYDAAYLALALESRIPLATIDKMLDAAAKTAGCRWKR